LSKSTQPTAPSPSGPAYVIRFKPDREGAPWMRIGALWPIKSGKGYRLSLEAMPLVPGSTLALPPEPRNPQEEEGA
jgi:hypothetical protein